MYLILTGYCSAEIKLDASKITNQIHEVAIDTKATKVQTDEIKQAMIMVLFIFHLIDQILINFVL